MAPNDPASRYSCLCVIPSSWIRPDLVTRLQQIEYNESYEFNYEVDTQKTLAFSPCLSLSLSLSLSEPLLGEEGWEGRGRSQRHVVWSPAEGPCGNKLMSWLTTNVNPRLPTAIQVSLEMGLLRHSDSHVSGLEGDPPSGKLCDDCSGYLDCSLGRNPESEIPR